LFVSRCPDKIIFAKSVPQEKQRLQVPEAFLSRTVQPLNEYVQRCITELVFNRHGIDISNWKDRKTRKVVAAGTMRGETMHHGITRNGKHISEIIWT
jgi:hypothetical protein